MNQDQLYREQTVCLDKDLGLELHPGQPSGTRAVETKVWPPVLLCIML